MSEENELKVGDVVELKSGGPAMTVVCVTDNNVGCAWFDGPRLMQADNDDAFFPVSSLKRIR